MTLKGTRESVVSLVHLRRFALRHLAGDSVAGKHSRYAIENVSPELWELFLAMERCASPLFASLTATRSLNQLPEQLRPLLASSATLETEMVLRAVREARILGAAALATGENVVLLKGGVAAVMSAIPPLHLSDVDVMAKSSTVVALETPLESSGFERAKNNEPHHIHWIAPKGRLDVEIHSTLYSDGSPIEPSIWSRVRPVAEIRGLSRLGWADHIIHVLRHSLDQHNDRQVRLRDILLIGWIDSQADESEREFLAANIAELPQSARYSDMLDLARRVRDGRDYHDPFEDETIIHFAAAIVSEKNPATGAGAALAWSRAATVAAGNASLHGLVGFAAKSPVTAKTGFSQMQQRFPAIGRAMTRWTRSVYYFLSIALGVPILNSIARSVRRDIQRDNGR